MSIESTLEQQGWHFEKREKWIAVKDERTVFRSVFNTNRVGKLIGSKFYVTVQDLQTVVERQIRTLGLEVECVASTAGGRDTKYVGFESAGVADVTLRSFSEQLHAAIDIQIKR